MIEQNEKIEGLHPDGFTATPDFIDRNFLNQRLTTTAISKLFSVGGMAASSYISRLKREGCELDFIREDCSNIHGFRNLYLVSDVVQSAINNNMVLAPPKSAAIKEFSEGLTLTHRRLSDDIDRLKRIKRDLLKEIDLMNGNLSDIAPVLSQTRFSLVPESALIEKSLSYGDACGVYFLIKDMAIVYIGQSINIASRITQHRDKEFDSVSYVACEKSEMDILESLYILAYKPPLNGIAGGNGQIRPATPMSLQMIISKFRK